ncbi:MAG: hypothetical protein KY476_13155 [Planctomycetes bacterium]|nr:hypothetical protein [Planctomycetota bacterium]
MFGHRKLLAVRAPARAGGSFTPEHGHRQRLRVFAHWGLDLLLIIALAAMIFLLLRLLPW